MKAILTGLACLAVLLLSACGDEINYGMDSSYTNTDGGVDSPDGGNANTGPDKFLQTVLPGDYLCTTCSYSKEATLKIYNNIPECKGMPLITLSFTFPEKKGGPAFCFDQKTLGILDSQDGKKLGQAYVHCQTLANEFGDEIQSLCLEKPASAFCESETDCGEKGVKFDFTMNERMVFVKE